MEWRKIIAVVKRKASCSYPVSILGKTSSPAAVGSRWRYLQAENIMPNRMTLARSIEQLEFPKPIASGKNRIAWDLDEVRAWLAARPRRTPKERRSKGCRSPMKKAGPEGPAKSL